MPFDLEKYKEDEAFKKAIADSIAEATVTLTNTNKGLLNDVKKFKATADQLSGIDLDALQRNNEAYQQMVKEKDSKETETEKALRELRESQEAQKTANEQQLATLRNANKALIVDGELARLLATQKIVPDLMNIAVTTLKNQAKVDDSSGVPVATIGGLPLAEAVAIWIDSPEGKHFIQAPVNAGGGAGGGTGGGTTPGEVTSEELAQYGKLFDPKSPEYNRTAQARVRIANPELHDKLRAHYSDVT